MAEKEKQSAAQAADTQAALTAEQEAAIAARVDALLKDAESKAAEKAQEILDAAEEKAAALLEKATAAEEKDEIKPPDNAYLNELVEIELFRDEKDYKDDVFVAVNGRTWLIQRGKRVKVPRYVAMHIEAGRQQDIKTAKLIAETQAQSRMDS